MYKSKDRCTGFLLQVGRRKLQSPMREARHRIAEVRKDRSFGQTTNGKGGGSKSKSKSKPAGDNPKKQDTFGWDCGECDHWGGDPQCGKPGAGLFRPKGKGSTGSNSKQVKITEALNTGCGAGQRSGRCT